MRILKSQFSKGLACGALLGLLVGASGLASAAVGKKAWDELGDGFQSGFVVGFLECLRIGRAYNPGGYLEKSFTLPKGEARARDWVNQINELYKDDANAQRQLPQMMVLAGAKLGKKFGEAPPVGAQAGLKALRSLIDARRKVLAEQRRAQANKGSEGEKSAADDESGDKPDPGVGEGGAENDDSGEEE